MVDSNDNVVLHEAGKSCIITLRVQEKYVNYTVLHVGRYTVKPRYVWDCRLQIALHG